MKHFAKKKKIPTYRKSKRNTSTFLESEKVITKTDLYRTLLKISKICLEEKLPYRDIFEDFASDYYTKLIPISNMKKCMEALFGDDKLVTNFEHQILQEFFEKVINKEKIMIQYEKLITEIELFIGALRAKEEVFRALRIHLIQRRMGIEDYLDELRTELQTHSAIDAESFQALIDELGVKTENDSHHKMICILTKGESIKRVSLDTLEAEYQKLVSNRSKRGGKRQQEDFRAEEQRKKELQEDDEVDEFLRQLRRSMDDLGIKSAKEVALEKLDMDTKGYVSYEEAKHLIRLLNPVVTVEEVKRLVGRIQHPKRDRFSVIELDRLMRGAVQVEKLKMEEGRLLSKDDINHRRNLTMKDILAAFARFAIRKKINFGEIFLFDDINNTSKIKWEKFLDACHSKGFVIFEDDEKYFKKRYLDKSHLVKYKEIEKDMAKVDEKYKSAFNPTKQSNNPKDRTPRNLVTNYSNYISREFSSLKEFSRTIDFESKGHISKKQLFDFFQKKIDDKLQEQEFYSICVLIDDRISSTRRIDHTQLENGLKKFVLPMLRIWVGEMLNSYNESKQGLGDHLEILRGDEPQKVEADRLKSAVFKLKKFPKKQFYFFLYLLGVEEDYDLMVEWRLFERNFSGIVKRYNLRTDEEMSQFFVKRGKNGMNQGSKTRARAMSGALGGFGDDSEDEKFTNRSRNFDTLNDPYKRNGASNKLSSISKFKSSSRKLQNAKKLKNTKSNFSDKSFDLQDSDEAYHLLKSLRKQYQLINEHKTAQIFKIYDENKSGYLAREEFELLCYAKFPNASHEDILKAFKFLSQGKEKVSLEKFCFKMIHAVKLDNKEELVYEATLWAEPIYSKINYGLKRDHVEVEDLLTDFEMKIPEVVDRLAGHCDIQHSYEVYNLMKQFKVPQEKKSKNENKSKKDEKNGKKRRRKGSSDPKNGKSELNSLKKGEESEEPNLMNTDEFMTVLKLHSTRNGTGSAKRQLDFVENTKIMEEAEKLEKYLKKKLNAKIYFAYELFEKIDSDAEKKTMSIQEFMRLIKELKHEIHQKAAQRLFDIIDEDQSGFISISEFKRFFEVKEIGAFKENIKRNRELFETIVFDIDDCLTRIGVSPEEKFFKGQRRVTKKNFLALLKDAKFEISKYKYFGKFCDAVKFDGVVGSAKGRKGPRSGSFGDESAQDYIDLEKFGFLYKSLKKGKLKKMIDLGLQEAREKERRQKEKLREGSDSKKELKSEENSQNLKNKKLKNQGEIELPEASGYDVELYLFDLCEEFNQSIRNAVDYLDFNKSGDISLPEFTIKSKKILGKDKYNYKALYAYLVSKGSGSAILSSEDLKIELYKVMSKYAQPGQQGGLPGGNQAQGNPFSANMGSQPGTNVNFASMTSINENYLEGQNNPFQAYNGAPSARLTNQAPPNPFSNPAINSRGSFISNPFKPISTRILARGEITNQTELLEKELYTKLRSCLRHDHEGLANSFRRLDEKNQRKIPANQAVQELYKLGVNPQLTPQELEILLDGITDAENNVFYLQMVQAIFPMSLRKNGAVITDLEGLVKEFKRQMKLKGVMTKEIFEQLKNLSSDQNTSRAMKDHRTRGQGSIDGEEMTRSQFMTGLKRMKLIISTEDFHDIFDLLDANKSNTVSLSNLKAAIFTSAHDSDYVLNKIYLEMKHRELSVQDLFKQAKIMYKKAESGLSFKEFSDVIKKLKVDVDIVDLETLFCVIDVDESDSISLEELQQAFGRFVEQEGQELSLNGFRKALYTYIVQQNTTLEALFAAIDIRRFGKLTKNHFFDLLETLGFKEAPEKDKIQLFEQINYKKTYKLSLNELKAAYDEKHILTLFPFVKDLKTKIIKEMEQQNIPLRTIIRRFDSDGDEIIDEVEFSKLSKKLKVKGLDRPEDTAFLFRCCDFDNNKQISEFEFREFLNGGQIIDIVEYIEQIKRTIQQQDLVDLFKEIDEDSDHEVSFDEFRALIARCGVKELEIIELDEIFTFLDKREKDAMAENDFMDVFGDYKPLDPMRYNPGYFQKLSPRQYKKYELKYDFLSKEGMDYVYDYDEMEDKENLLRFNKQRARRDGRGVEVRSKKELGLGATNFEDPAELDKFSAMLEAAVDKRIKQYGGGSLEEVLMGFASPDTDYIDYKGFSKLCRLSRYSRKKGAMVNEIFDHLADRKNRIKVKKLEKLVENLSRKKGGSGGFGGVKRDKSKGVGFEDAQEPVSDQKLDLILRAVEEKARGGVHPKITLDDLYYDLRAQNGPGKRKPVTKDDLKRFVEKFDRTGQIDPRYTNEIIEFLYMPEEQGDGALMGRMGHSGQNSRNSKSKNFAVRMGISYQETLPSGRNESMQSLPYPSYSKNRLHTTSSKEEVSRVLNLLRNTIIQQDLYPEEYFYELSPPNLESAKINRVLFKKVLQKKGLKIHPEAIDELFDHLKPANESSIDAKEFFRKIEEAVDFGDYEEMSSARNYANDGLFDYEKACNSLKKYFLSMNFEKKKLYFIDIFAKYSDKTGHWTLERYYRFLDAEKEKIFPGEVSGKQELALFKYLDHDHDEKLAESEFFGRIMQKEYKTAIMKKYSNCVDYVASIKKSLKQKRFKDIYDCLKISTPVVKIRKFKSSIMNYEVDTLDPNFKLLVKSFRSKEKGPDYLDLGRLNDLMKMVSIDVRGDEGAVRSPGGRAGRFKSMRTWRDGGERSAGAGSRGSGGKVKRKVRTMNDFGAGRTDRMEGLRRGLREGDDDDDNRRGNVTPDEKSRKRGRDGKRESYKRNKRRSFEEDQEDYDIDLYIKNEDSRDDYFTDESDSLSRDDRERTNNKSNRRGERSRRNDSSSPKFTRTTSNGKHRRTVGRFGRERSERSPFGNSSNDSDYPGQRGSRGPSRRREGSRGYRDRLRGRDDDEEYSDVKEELMNTLKGGRSSAKFGGRSRWGRAVGRR